MFIWEVKKTDLVVSSILLKVAVFNTKPKDHSHRRLDPGVGAGIDRPALNEVVLRAPPKLVHSHIHQLSSPTQVHIGKGK